MINTGQRTSHHGSHHSIKNMGSVESYNSGTCFFFNQYLRKPTSTSTYYFQSTRKGKVRNIYKRTHRVIKEAISIRITAVGEKGSSVMRKTIKGLQSIHSSEKALFNETGCGFYKDELTMEILMAGFCAVVRLSWWAWLLAFASHCRHSPTTS